MADHVGQQIGNYRLLRLIGEGGFAEVYLGEHSYLGTHAAIKILYTRVAQSDIALFQQEARMLANLIHPHIIRVLDFGVADRTPYLVMDYAPGGTLRTRHPKGTRLPLTTIVEYVKQIAQALQFAHDQKLIHRDVKPENMLLGRNGEILLSDFGIALIVQSSRYQSTRDMAGTITYMAPEQIEAHPRPSSDQYSLGIVVYEWLSGKRPFQGSFTEIAIKHSVTPPPSLHEQLPTLSPTVQEVVFTALAKKPEERFASVYAFAIALEQASRNSEVQPPLLHASQPSSQPPAETVSFTESAVIPPAQSTPVRSEEPITPTLSASPSITTTPPDQLIPSSPVTQRDQSSLSATSTPQLISPSPTTPTESQHEPTTRGISRRALMLGLTGITTAGIIGIGVFWFTRTSPQGTRLATSQGKLFVKYSGHSFSVNSVAWSPGGQRIASSSADNTVQVWNANNGSQPFTYQGHSSGVNSVAWSPGGQRIASGSDDGTVQVWNASDGSQPFTYQGHFFYSVNSVAWSPNGQRIASGAANNTGDSTVQVWNASDGSQPFTYRGHSNSVTSVVWSPSGQRIASGSDDGTVQVWNASNGSQPFTYRGHSDSVYSVAWSPDGKRIASGSADHTVQVWNASDGSQAFTYREHSSTVNSVAWSPDGQRIASGSIDKTVQVWQAI